MIFVIQKLQFYIRKKTKVSTCDRSNDAPDPGKKGVLIVLPGDFFRIHWKWYYIAMTKIASRKKQAMVNAIQRTSLLKFLCYFHLSLHIFYNFFIMNIQTIFGT